MSTAKITVTAKIAGQPDLVDTETITIQEVSSKVSWGTFGSRTDGSKYAAPSGADPTGTHAYGGVSGWGQPLLPTTVIANIRPRGKEDPLPSSVVDKVLSGGLDSTWQARANDIKKLSHDIYCTIWHEPLRSEFFGGEPTQRWSEVFLYVMDFFANAGVNNVVWHSCLMASQYNPNTNSPQGGDTYHTPALIERLDGVGADLYLSANSWHPATDKEWQAFTNYHPEKDHSLLEFALWSDPSHQEECYNEVDA